MYNFKIEEIRFKNNLQTLFDETGINIGLVSTIIHYVVYWYMFT